MFRRKMFETHKQIDVEIMEIMEKNNKFKDELNKAIKNCINHYQQIVSYCQIMEKFFSPVMFPGILFGLFYLIFTTFCVVIVMYPRKSLSKRFTLIVSDGR